MEKKAYLPLLTLAFSLQAPCPASPSFNDFEQPPHSYWEGPFLDPATALHLAISSGDRVLPAGDPLAFLAAYLEALDVPVESQILVFSKSSLQAPAITLDNPRAMFFNEDTYVTYIPGARIEVMSVDPRKGGVFYIFDPPPASHPTPEFDQMRRCMGCHAGSFTNFLPGPMALSLHTRADGRVATRLPEDRRGHAIPYEDRWGGWLLTGDPGQLPHLANQVAPASRDGTPPILIAPTSEALGEHFDWKKFPRQTSDVAALLLHDHQIGAVNLFVEANYRVRTAYHQAGWEGDIHPTPELEGRAAKHLTQQAERVVRYLLFVDEPTLPSPIAADPGFVTSFQARQPVDPAGRSLKQLDLDSHLLRYRCSYMIGSLAFRGLPQSFKQQIYTRLAAILASSPGQEPEYDHLPQDERAAILSILRHAHQLPL